MRSLRLQALLSSAVLSAAALGILAPAAQAREGADDTVRFSLEAKDQPRAHRPELEKIKERAKANGVSLGRQLKSEFGKLKKVSDSDYPDAEVDGIHAMRFADLEVIAENEGLTLEQAVEEYGWEDRFTDLARYISEKYPDTHAGYAIREVDGTRRGWVAFKGDVPQDVIEEAKKISAPIDFEGRKGYSYNEVQAAVEKAAAGFKDKNGTHAVSADPFTGEVQVNAHAAVKDHDDWLRGGGYLDRNLPSQCTSGFNIEKDGIYSPMAAGHCVPAGFVDTYFMTYQLHGGDGSSTTPVYSKLRHVGSYGDFSRFGPGKMKATDTFYENLNTKRYVTRVIPANEVYAGRAVCKFGTKSGRSCSAIRRVNIAVASAAGTAYRLVSMETETTVGGDSGGPWFVGGEAMGITKGAYFEDGYRRDLISQAHLVPSALNGWKIRVH